MAVKNTQSRRIPADRLEKTHFTLTAISQLKDFSPFRKEYGTEKIGLHQEALRHLKAEEIAAENALAKARDAVTKAEWDAYNFSLNAAEQVMGQYDSDSDEYASLGYKKKSEYKKTAPGTKAKKNAAAEKN